MVFPYSYYLSSYYYLGERMAVIRQLMTNEHTE